MRMRPGWVHRRLNDTQKLLQHWGLLVNCLLHGDSETALRSTSTKRIGKSGLGAARLLVLGVSAIVLSSCVSSVAPTSQLTNESAASNDLVETDLQLSAAPVETQQLASMEDGQKVAIPVRSPGYATSIQPNDPQTPEKPVETALVEGEQQVMSQAEAAANQVAEKQTTVNGRTEPLNPPANEQTTATNEQPAETAKPKKKQSIFALLFQRSKKPASNQAVDDRDSELLASTRSNARGFAPPVGGTPSVQKLAGLPGVRERENLLIAPKNGDKMDADKAFRIASATGLARFSPTSLKTQHANVDVKCIVPELVKLVKIVERKYGRDAIVTSGYRSPSRNRRAGGARNSMHIYCKAVDIQVEGVSKWQLAKFLRTLPNRGGVGTYCRTRSVHLDIGPKRDWHHACRRKSKRRKS